MLQRENTYTRRITCYRWSHKPREGLISKVRRPHTYQQNNTNTYTQHKQTTHNTYTTFTNICNMPLTKFTPYTLSTRHMLHAPHITKSNIFHFSHKQTHTYQQNNTNTSTQHKQTIHNTCTTFTNICNMPLTQIHTLHLKHTTHASCSTYHKIQHFSFFTQTKQHLSTKQHKYIHTI